MPPSAPLALEVVGGADDGVRLFVGSDVYSIGRARDSDLVLRDLSVSRRHVRVTATPGGALVETYEGATAFTVGGKPHRSFEAKVGDRIVIGNVVLSVVAQPSVAPPQAMGADAQTQATGVGADALAMAQIHDLIEALDAATDQASLAVALDRWTALLRPFCRVEVRRDAGEQAPAARRAPNETTLLVPAPSDDPATLEFHFTTPGDLPGDSFRRMLLVAGRLYGSALSHARRAAVASEEVASLRALSFGGARHFLGSSPSALELAARIPKLAAADVTVLLDGETGVGKSFVARLLHEASPRASEPLRVVNCAAIPEALLEGELFGHERGAFTGAVASRAGALEAAGKGTLFLDEIGELSLASQAKLLRALEEKQFERLGSNRPLTLRARVICATNRDLAAMAKAGRFRSDLLFRISVVKLRIPPLRERGEDLVLLARQLLADVAASGHRRVDDFADATLDVIRTYSWPGNVRELRNALEHALVLGEDRVVQPTDLPAGIMARALDPPDRGSVSMLIDAVDVAEREAVTKALEATGGNRTRAAALLGISRVTLHAKLRRM